MGLIREPEGVDFVIKSRSLTKKEAELLSKYIQEQKAKRSTKLASKKISSKRATTRKRKTGKE